MLCTRGVLSEHIDKRAEQELRRMVDLDGVGERTTRRWPRWVCCQAVEAIKLAKSKGFAVDTTRWCSTRTGAYLIEILDDIKNEFKVDRLEIALVTPSQGPDQTASSA